MGAGFDEMGRPSWDVLYMALAFVWAEKSLDPHTKHGCVMCGEDHTQLSCGFNSPPRGSIDSQMPLTRPEKYCIFEHAECNSIINAARTGTSLKGAKVYITGHPCADCYRKLLNIDAQSIVYGPINSKCIDDNHMEAIRLMQLGRENKLVEFDNLEASYEILIRAADRIKKYRDERKIND